MSLKYAVFFSDGFPNTGIFIGAYNTNAIDTGFLSNYGFHTPFGKILSSSLSSIQHLEIVLNLKSRLGVRLLA